MKKCNFEGFLTCANIHKKIIFGIVLRVKMMAKNGENLVWQYFLQSRKNYKFVSNSINLS